MSPFAVICITLACSCCVVFSQNVTTTARPMMESGEHESFTFFYDSTTHQMLMLTEGKCYIWHLTMVERNQIHTDTGMKAVELRLLGQVRKSFFTKVPRAVLHTEIVRRCASGPNKHPAFYLVH